MEAESDPPDFIAELYQALSGSVSQCLPSTGSVAVTLSGGLDSRALLGCALNAGASPSTYTFGTPGSTDVKFAAELATRAGATHRVVEIQPGFLPRWLDHAVEVTGGMVGAVHFHILSLADAISGQHSCILDGLGGDALTGAHLNWGMYAHRSRDRVVEAVFRQRASAFSTLEERRKILDPGWASEWPDPREAVVRHARGFEGPAWWVAHRFDLFERQRRFIQFGPHLLRPFAAVRTPFYGSRVVQLMLSAGWKQLFEQRAYRSMHSRFLPALAAVPETGRNLPVSASTARRVARRLEFAFLRRIRGRSQTGSSPTNYPAWFRTSLKSYLQEQLLDEPAALQGLVRRPAIESILKNHAEGNADYSNRLGVLLSLSAWLRSVGGVPS